MTKIKEVEIPAKPDMVDFEAFNTAFMEYQASMRQELRRLILEEITTADFKDISGLRVAAEIVWNEDKEEEVDGRG